MTDTLVLDFDGVITRKKTGGFMLRSRVTKEAVLEYIVNPDRLKNCLKSALAQGIPVAIASHAAAPSDSYLMKYKKKLSDYLYGEELIRTFLLLAFDDEELINQIIIESYSGSDKSVHLEQVQQKIKTEPNKITLFDDLETNVSAAIAKGYQAILIIKGTDLAALLEQFIAEKLPPEECKEISEITGEPTITTIDMKKRTTTDSDMEDPNLAKLKRGRKKENANTNSLIKHGIFYDGLPDKVDSTATVGMKLPGQI